MDFWSSVPPATQRLLPSIIKCPSESLKRPISSASDRQRIAPSNNNSSVQAQFASFVRPKILMFGRSIFGISEDARRTSPI